MAKVFIDGEAGTTGLGIRDRLSKLPGIELISLADAVRKDYGARLEAMKAADLVVLCLPDEAAKDAAAMASGLGQDAPKLLDASSAHRTAPGWVYGFPELSPTSALEIIQAPRVSNPGCYATGAIGLLRPLIAAGLLENDREIAINAVSGYSGGGKSMIAEHEAKGGPAFQLYALGLTHKHVPEIMLHSGLTQRPIFVPSVGHFRQGMLVSIPLFRDCLNGAPSARDVIATYEAAYGAAGKVIVHHQGEVHELTPLDKHGTDTMELFVFENEQHGHMILVAQLDNLGKGASGAAVQNISLMLGLMDANLKMQELANA
jgi:N-acetyl-gamma-glutamyl-phosphate reductase